MVPHLWIRHASCSARVYRHIQVQQSCFPDSQFPAVGLFLNPFLGQDFACSLLSYIMFLCSSFFQSVPLKGSTVLKDVTALKTAGLHSTPSKEFKTKGYLCQQTTNSAAQNYVLLLPSKPICFFLPGFQLDCSCITINLALIFSIFSSCSTKQDTHNRMIESFSVRTKVYPTGEYDLPEQKEPGWRRSQQLLTPALVSGKYPQIILHFLLWLLILIYWAKVQVSKHLCVWSISGRSERQYPVTVTSSTARGSRPWL